MWADGTERMSSSTEKQHLTARPDYAPRPPRRWLRSCAKWTALIAFIVIVILMYPKAKYGVVATWLQYRCSHYQPDFATPVWVEIPMDQDRSQEVGGRYPRLTHYRGGYGFEPLGRTFPVWNSLLACTEPLNSAYTPQATLFLGKLSTSNGGDVLLAVEASGDYNPYRLEVSHPKDLLRFPGNHLPLLFRIHKLQTALGRVLKSESFYAGYRFAPIIRAYAERHEWLPEFRIYPGRVDEKDRTRFWCKIEFGEYSGRFVGRNLADGTVEFTVEGLDVLLTANNN